MNEGTSVRAKRVFELLQKKYDCTLIIRGKHDSKSNNVEVIRPSKLWNLQLIPVVLKNRFDLVYMRKRFLGLFYLLRVSQAADRAKSFLKRTEFMSLERDSSVCLIHTPTDKVSFKMAEMAREVRDQTCRLHNCVS